MAEEQQQWVSVKEVGVVADRNAKHRRTMEVCAWSYSATKTLSHGTKLIIFVLLHYAFSQCTNQSNQRFIYEHLRLVFAVIAESSQTDRIFVSVF